MSYDIYLRDKDGNALEAKEAHNLAGGTYCLGGTNDLWLNVTYNYAPHFYRLINSEKGIRWLYGQRAADTIPKLEEAISALADDRDNDYWKATEGNAKIALQNLVALARMAPEGIWDGD